MSATPADVPAIADCPDWTDPPHFRPDEDFSMIDTCGAWERLRSLAAQVPSAGPVERAALAVDLARAWADLDGGGPALRWSGLDWPTGR